jgi:phage terminase large subunit
MKQIVNSKYASALQTDKRYSLLIGGRSAGRSYFASQLALAKLFAPQYFRCAIMRFVLTDIRKSIYQEIRDRIEEQEVEEFVHINDQPMTMEHKKNSITGIGFRKSSSDQKSKLKSLASYNFIIIEEADEIQMEDFMQLDDSLRTVKGDIRVMMMLNPPHRTHWIVKNWMNLEPSGVDGFYLPKLKTERESDTLLIHTTYRDNTKNLNQSTLANFKRYETDNPDYYHNMIQGLISEGMRGRIYTTWQTIPDAEFEALDFPTYYGLDFGFKNDPTAIVAIKEHNNRVYLRELLYETGLTNPDICARLPALGIPRTAVIYADEAEPKSIEEILREGWNVKSAVKGSGSRKTGVNYLLSKEVYYTEGSINLAQEVQTYCWQLDRDKMPTNEPADGNDHLLDASRYGVYTHSRKSFTGLY